jgi:hypothetical protein
MANEPAADEMAEAPIFDPVAWERRVAEARARRLAALEKRARDDGQTPSGLEELQARYQQRGDDAAVPPPAELPVPFRAAVAREPSAAPVPAGPPPAAARQPAPRPQPETERPVPRASRRQPSTQRLALMFVAGLSLGLVTAIWYGRMPADDVAGTVAPPPAAEPIEGPVAAPTTAAVTDPDVTPSAAPEAEPVSEPPASAEGLPPQAPSTEPPSPTSVAVAEPLAKPVIPDSAREAPVPAAGATNEVPEAAPPLADAPSVPEFAATEEMIEPAVTPGAGPAAIPAGTRVFVHAPTGVPAERAAGVVETLQAAGFDARGPIPASVSVSAANARFFHAGDARLAEAVVAALEGGPAEAPVARDFTHLTARTSPGTLEVWLAGEAATPAPSAPSSSAPSSSAPSPSAPSPSAPIPSAPAQSVAPAPPGGLPLSAIPPLVSSPDQAAPATVPLAVPAAPGAINANRLRALVEAARTD